MGNELPCTVANSVETFGENSSFDFKLQGWPAAVALVGCTICLTALGCKYIDAQVAVHKISAGMNIALSRAYMILPIPHAPQGR